MSFPRTHSPRPSGSREQEDLTLMIKAFRDSMEAKLDLHSQKLTALVANIPRTDEGFEDLSQRITVLKIIKSIFAQTRKRNRKSSPQTKRGRR